MLCQRCGKDAEVTTGSYFNEDMVCMECVEEEKRHPMYKEAKRVENEEVKKGNYNYKGIGLPEDLKK